MRRRGRLVLVAIAVAIACAPINRPPSPDAPVNACPLHPCIDYVPGLAQMDDAGLGDASDTDGPVCVNNVCLASGPAMASLQHLILVVALPFDSPIAPPGTTPGATYARPYANLNATPGAGPPGSRPVVGLPGQNPVTGIYWVTPGTAYNQHLPFGQLNFWVNEMANTAIPVHVVYRALWPPPGSSIGGSDGGSNAPLREATGLGLPLEPLQAANSLRSSYVFGSGEAALGPAEGLALVFSASLQPDIMYERTITPDPPFNVAFPPDVRRDQLASLSPTQEVELVPDTITIVDPTGMPVQSIPHFYLTSAQGIEGWSAYLRDTTTKRPLSPIRTLHDSTADAGVFLPTSHHPQDGGNALTNAELVLVPQVDSGLPTYVPGFSEFVSQVNYPLVPEPVTITGTIDSFDGQPSAAEVTFEATGIYAATLQPVEQKDAGAPDATTSGASDAGTTTFPLTPNFEYANTQMAEPDAGTVTYGVQIPRGTYRVSVRPRDAQVASTADASSDAAQDASAVDASPGIRHAVTVVVYDTGTSGDAGPPSLMLGPTTSVRGTATVVDGRALSAATVEAIPAHCPVVADAGGPPNDSPWCMPRYASTTTDSAGTFALDLDPGDYILRVEPLNGTRLPWVFRPLSVSPSNQTEPITMVIPAPVYRGLELREASNLVNPVANAIVRIFTMQGRGPAIEVGRAITDENGRFDMYLDPTVQ